MKLDIYIYIFFDSNFFENFFENKKTIRDCPRVEHRKTWCRIRMRSLILVSEPVSTLIEKKISM